jgi:hypothetical protein
MAVITINGRRLSRFALPVIYMVAGLVLAFMSRDDRPFAIPLAAIIFWARGNYLFARAGQAK